MQRPVSIIYFDRLFWLSLFVGFLSPVFAWDRMMADIARDAATISPNVAVTIVVVILVAMAAISVAFWYGIARRASNVVKWIYVVWMGFSALAALADPFHSEGLRGFALGASLVSAALTLASIICLFRPDAVAWFSNRGGVDPKVFD